MSSDAINNGSSCGTSPVAASQSGQNDGNHAETTQPPVSGVQTPPIQAQEQSNGAVVDGNGEARPKLEMTPERLEAYNFLCYVVALFLSGLPFRDFKLFRYALMMRGDKNVQKLVCAFWNSDEADRVGQRVADSYGFRDDEKPARTDGQDSSAPGIVPPLATPFGTSPSTTSSDTRSGERSPDSAATRSGFASATGSFSSGMGFFNDASWQTFFGWPTSVPDVGVPGRRRHAYVEEISRCDPPRRSPDREETGASEMHTPPEPQAEDVAAEVVDRESIRENQGAETASAVPSASESPTETGNRFGNTSQRDSSYPRFFPTREHVGTVGVSTLLLRRGA
jgi:hypothetical protein